MSADLDVVVVGARVAGALTAWRLARAGARVVVLDAAAFPSDTMSTHFFRGDGLVRSIDEMGVLDEVLSSGAPPLRAELSYADGGSVGVVGEPQEPGDIGFGLSVRRRTLDAILADHVARLPDVTLRTRTRVTDLVRKDSRVVGVVLDDGTRLGADLVVGADGRRSVVAARAGAGVVEQHGAARVMYFQYVSGWTSPEGGPPSMPEFSTLDDELAYVFPSDHQVSCVALSLNVAMWSTSSARRREDFRSHLRLHAGIWSRLERCEWLGRLVAASPRESVVHDAAGPGWALVGDAGTHQDPWTGFGMDTAARQAKALASSLDHDDWPEAYRHARDEVTMEHFHYTVTVAPDLRNG